MTSSHPDASQPLRPPILTQEISLHTDHVRQGDNLVPVHTPRRNWLSRSYKAYNSNEAQRSPCENRYVFFAQAIIRSCFSRQGSWTDSWAARNVRNHQTNLCFTEETVLWESVADRILPSSRSSTKVGKMLSETFSLECLALSDTLIESELVVNIERTWQKWTSQKKIYQPLPFSASELVKNGPLAVGSFYIPLINKHFQQYETPWADASAIEKGASCDEHISNRGYWFWSRPKQRLPPHIRLCACTERTISSSFKLHRCAARRHNHS